MTITDDYNFARMEGTCTHLIAVHTDESAPAPTWWYNGGVGFAPPPFGMRAGRIRGAVYHAGATHWDNYLEDIGTFVGTVPGPSVVPMVAFIQGSIGRHPDSGEPVTFCAGADLTPPSGLPSLPDQDYPAGQMIVMVDQTSFIGAMAVAAVGLSRQNVLAASIREGGPVGPIMFDLGPGEMWTDLGGQGIARAYADLPFPPSLVQDMMAGIAYVQITTVAHPDGMIGGHLVAVQEGPSGVGDLPDGDEVLAYSAAPNPFNPATRVAFQLAQASRVRLEIFDASGRRVRVLLDEQMPAGAHTAAWDGAADNGRQQGSGVYFCRIKAGDYVKTIKLALLK